MRARTTLNVEQYRAAHRPRTLLRVYMYALRARRARECLLLNRAQGTRRMAHARPGTGHLQVGFCPDSHLAVMATTARQGQSGNETSEGQRPQPGQCHYKGRTSPDTWRGWPRATGQHSVRLGRPGRRRERRGVSGPSAW
jgi:hypothetical protein